MSEGSKIPFDGVEYTAQEFAEKFDIYYPRVRALRREGLDGAGILIAVTQSYQDKRGLARLPLETWARISGIPEAEIERRIAAGVKKHKLLLPTDPVKKATGRPTKQDEIVIIDSVSTGISRGDLMQATGITAAVLGNYLRGTHKPSEIVKLAIFLHETFAQTEGGKDVWRSIFAQAQDLVGQRLSLPEEVDIATLSWASGLPIASLERELSGKSPSLLLRTIVLLHSLIGHRNWMTVLTAYRGSPQEIEAIRRKHQRALERASSKEVVEQLRPHIIEALKRRGPLGVFQLELEIEEATGDTPAYQETIAALRALEQTGELVSEGELWDCKDQRQR